MSRELHKQSFVCDLHCDTVLAMASGRDISQRCSEGHIDLPRLREGGVDLQLFACYASPSLSGFEAFARVNQLIDTIEQFISKNSDQVALCTSYTNSKAVRQKNKIGIMIAIENGSAINNDLDNLNHFHGRGVRYMTLTHVKSTDWCISANDEQPPFDGLTDFGRIVIERMNELGVIVDVSHIAPIAVDKVLEISAKPIIASHSNAKAICNHIRNLSDKHIRAIADNGGMIGVNFCRDFVNEKAAEVSGAYLTENPATWQLAEELDKYHIDTEEYQTCRNKLQPLLQQWRAVYDTAPVTIEHLVDHIDYLINVGGEDHVGLGSDYDGIYYPPEGLSDVSALPNITDLLLKRGHKESIVEKVLGRNFLRVLSDVCG